MKSQEKLSVGRLSVLGLQHVLAMYAGAVAVPIIVGGSIGLNQNEIAILVAADLFTCGLATIIQSLGIGKFVGIRLPVIMGVSFATVGPMIGIGGKHGIQAIFGAVIVAGIFALLLAPFFSRLVRFFPNIVNGSIVTVIGLTLIPVGINNAAGGLGNPEFGALKYFLISVFVILIILLVNKFFKGFVQSIAVIIGLIAGTALAAGLGMVDFTPVMEAEVLKVVTPFAFGLPVFEIQSILTMCIVILVVMTESMGCFFTIGNIAGTKIDRNALTRGYRAEGFGAILGGVFNCFPYTTFGQNIGLLSLTKVTSRFVAVAAGIILVILGLIPKFAALATIIPATVFGGATIIMFSMVAIGGIEMLQKVDFSQNKNMLIAGTSIALGLGIGVVPEYFSGLPETVQMLTGNSGTIVAALVAVVLNIVFNFDEVFKKNKPQEGEI